MRILVRSLAMMNKVGALRLAATVWPTLTFREITMPSIGERIVATGQIHRGLFSKALR